MKPTIILPLAAACIVPFVFNSCSMDPEYREWKKSNSPAAPTSNPYGVPQAGGEVGSYAPSSSPQSAPYQPLPGVGQPNTAGSVAAAPAPVAPTAGAVSHTVVSGDSLWGISRKYGTTIEAIQAANGLTDTTIRTGQQLTIPGR